MVLTGLVSYGPLLDAATLAAALSRSDRPMLLDVRWHLAGPPGREEYDAGHLPDAVFLDLEAGICGPAGAGGRHPLPDPAVLQAALRAAGVRAGHPVVAYDAGDGAPAARTWWTLRWAGHPEVAVLDGGYRAWVAAGLPVTKEVSVPSPGDIVVRPGGMPVLSAADAADVGGRGVLLDVRVPARYRGETEPIDPVAGHIPGALNLPAADLVAPDGTVLPASELRSRFAAAGVVAGLPVAAYCGSGVTAAHTVLALHLAGRADAGLYVGSWSHWVTDSGRPVATGAAP
jgi:thiosulfate/3-mercaptopyruvate sulfurtransferase